MNSFRANKNNVSNAILINKNIFSLKIQNKPNSVKIFLLSDSVHETGEDI